MAQTNDTKFKQTKLEIPIHGVIKAIEQIKSQRGDFYANTIVIPAPDTMTAPKRLVVYSQMPMGREDTVVDQSVFLNSSFKNRNGKWFNQISLWNEPANR